MVSNRVQLAGKESTQDNALRASRGSIEERRSICPLQAPDIPPPSWEKCGSGQTSGSFQSPVECAADKNGSLAL